MRELLQRLNVVAECRAAKLGFWSCPPFLFVVMGVVDMAGILTSYLFANRYVEEPEAAALVVLAVAIVIFIIGNFVIHGFNRIAEANRIKSEFIAIVSHQLRSPLAVFKWTLDALATGSSSARVGDQISYHRILSENTEKMIQLVNILLDVSRIEAGRFRVAREPLSLETLTAELLRSFEPYAAASRISLALRTTGEAVAPVVGDRERLKMVIQNLVDNAVRYSPAGGAVTVRTLPGGAGTVEWQVEDQGIGIPREEQQFIFQKFYRTGLARRQQTEGTGIGLYISKAVIEALGGEIGFRSEAGKGSTFWFRLPVYR